MKPILLIAIPAIALVLGLAGLLSYGRRVVEKQRTANVSQQTAIGERDAKISTLTTQRDELAKKYDKEWSDGLKCVTAALSIAGERDEARAKLRRRARVMSEPPAMEGFTFIDRGKSVLVLQRDGSWKPVEVE
jgi:hypothetical protein